jgi:serine/threonine protein kinase
MASERVLELAELFASGHEVDWADEANSSANEQERGVIKSMGVLAAISALHSSDPAPTALQDEEPTRDIASEDLTATLPRWRHLERLERIGEGSFGTVYKAWDPNLQTWVALKLAREDRMERDDMEDLLEEARLLARVRHENVVVVHGADVHEGRAGIWMEYIEGRNFSEIVRSDGRLSEDEAIGIGRVLAKAVAVVHAEGVIHKDIKAHNVMREEGGRLVLMDFGAGARLDDTWVESWDAPLRGTPHYLAPELLEGEPASVRSDVYSLGVLLFYLVTGRYPVDARNFEELCSAHRNGRVLSVMDVRPELSTNFCAVIDKALHPEPDERYENAARMAQALEEIRGTRRFEEDEQDGKKRNAHLRIMITIAATIALATVSTWGLHRHFSAFRVDASLFRQESNSLTELFPGARVQVDDRLYLELESTKSLYVYVINQDARGRAALLFPVKGLTPANPIEPSQKQHLPGFRGDEQVFWRVTSAGERELFLIIASRDPLEDLEEMLDELPEPKFDQPVSFADIRSPKLNRLRGVLGLAVADSTQAPVDTALLERITDLTGEQETARGVWVRRIELLNPE